MICRMIQSDINNASGASSTNCPMARMLIRLTGRRLTVGKTLNKRLELYVRWRAKKGLTQ